MRDLYNDTYRKERTNVIEHIGKEVDEITQKNAQLKIDNINEYLDRHGFNIFDFTRSDVMKKMIYDFFSTYDDSIVYKKEEKNDNLGQENYDDTIIKKSFGENKKLFDNFIQLQMRRMLIFLFKEYDINKDNARQIMDVLFNNIDRIFNKQKDKIFNGDDVRMLKIIGYMPIIINDIK